MSFLPSLLTESLHFFKGLFYWVSQNVHSRVDCHAFVHEGTLLYNFYLFQTIYLSRRRQWHPTPVLLPGKSHGQRSLVGCSPWGSLRVGHYWATSLSLFTFLHWRRKWQPILAWRTPGKGEPGGLLSMGSHRVRHDWSDLEAAAELIQGLLSLEKVSEMW